MHTWTLEASYSERLARSELTRGLRGQCVNALTACQDRGRRRLVKAFVPLYKWDVK